MTVTSKGLAPPPAKENVVKKLVSLGALAASLMFVAPVRAAIIDFEDLAQAPGTDMVVGDITSRGFLFDSSTDHGHLVNDNFVSFNGTTWFGIDDFLCNSCPPGDNIVTMQNLTGATFSLERLEISEFFPPPPNGVTVLVTGNIAGGGTVSRVIVLDEIADGSGPLDDFQTEIFDASWMNLTSVTFDAITGGGDRWYALDNIQVDFAAELPAPGTLALLAIGLAGFGFRRSKSAEAA